VDGGVLAGRFLVEKQFSNGSGFGRDFGGLYVSRYIADREIDQSWTSSSANDQPGKVLIQLESLILAQSERWRQA
jgi:hypothetical protein